MWFCTCQFFYLSSIPKNAADRCFFYSGFLEILGLPALLLFRATFLPKMCELQFENRAVYVQVNVRLFSSDIRDWTEAIQKWVT